MKRRSPRTESILPAVLIAAGCAGAPAPVAPPPGPVPVAVRAEPRGVQLTEAEVRAIAELLLMEDRRQLDRDRIITLATHWSPEVRRRTALAIGRVRDEAVLPLVVQALDDPVDAVRVDAAFALGLAGDTATHIVAALAGLLPEHAADSLGVEAVAALARLGSEPARRAIFELLGSADVQAPSPAVREALLTLWRVGRDIRDVVSLPGRFLGSLDADVRWRAAYPLVRAGTPAAVPLLLPLAADPDADVRAIAIRALRSPAADSAGRRDAATAALQGALADSAPHVRINAAAALASYREPGLLTGVYPLLTDDDGNVRMAAVQAVSAVNGPGSAAALLRLAGNAAERIGIRAAALTGLAGADATAAAAEARRWAGSADWLTRFFAARTLGSLTPAQVGSLLATLAADPDTRVAVAAIDAASRMDTVEGARALFLEKLRAREVRVRAAAVSALGRLASPGDLAVLLDAYEASVNDASPAAAMAAVNALGSLQQGGAPVENAFFTRFEAHPDASVRQLVERRFGRGWDWDEVTEPPPGVGFYEDVVRDLVVPALAGARPALVFDGPAGRIEVELATAEAPLTVHNIIALIGSGYFEPGDDPASRRWHRVVPNFVLQDGEPVGDGSGSAGYSIRDEINRLRYSRGMLGMALSGPDTGGSQFFITHSPQPHLDGGYTVFGRVVNGIDAADRVVQDDAVGTMQVIWP